MCCIKMIFKLIFQEHVDNPHPLYLIGYTLGCCTTLIVYEDPGMKKPFDAILQLEQNFYIKSDNKHKVSRWVIIYTIFLGQLYEKMDSLIKIFVTSKMLVEETIDKDRLRIRRHFSSWKI